MLDLDLISNDIIVQMRDRPKTLTWKKRMKDAGAKAARTQMLRSRGRKAAATRLANTKHEEV